MSKPSQHVEMTVDLAAEPDAIFSYFTDHFDEIWAGKQSQVRPAAEGSEPMGLGYVRRVDPPGLKAHLDEEIVTHQRPSLIEYKVINGDDAPIHNHLGRIEFNPGPGDKGTSVRYTVDFDTRPGFAGPIAKGVLAAGWKLDVTQRLRKKFGAP